MSKNKQMSEWGKLGGKAAAGKGAKGYWEKLSKEEKSEELKKRATKRIKK